MTARNFTATLSVNRSLIETRQGRPNREEEEDQKKAS